MVPLVWSGPSMYTQIDTFPTTECSGSPISTTFYPASLPSVYCTGVSLTTSVEVNVYYFSSGPPIGSFCIRDLNCANGQCDIIDSSTSCTYGTTGFNVLASWPQYNNYEWLQINRCPILPAPITSYYPLSVCTFVNTTAGYQKSSLINGNQIQRCTASNSVCTSDVSCHVYDLNICTNAETYTVLPAPASLSSSSSSSTGPLRSSTGNDAAITYGSTGSSQSLTPQSTLSSSSSTGESIPISTSTGFDPITSASQPQSSISSILFIIFTCIAVFYV